MGDLIKNRLIHLIVGLDLIGIGIYLIVMDHYFWWPPSLAWIANSNLFGGFFVFSGFSFLAWVFLQLPPVAHAWIASVGCFLMMFLASYQLIHSIVANTHMPWLSNFAMGLVIMVLAYRGEGF